MSRSGRALLAPEVIQASAMDCGPAALKSLLEGHGLPVSYGRLREACQVDLDGTSIDTLEEVAARLGLAAEQVMVPADHLTARAARALPAVAVVRQPNGTTHFVLLWRRLGPLVQVMDPATGRHWLPVRRLRERLYLHRMTVPAADWREWAGSEEALAVLREQLAEMGVPPAEARELIDDALADPGWRGLAALDAAARLTRALVASGGLPRRRAGAALWACRDRCREPGGEATVPDAYWPVRPAPAGDDGEEQVALSGAVLVRVRGRAAGAEAPAPAPAAGLFPDRPELAAALAEPPERPGRELLRRLLAAAGALAPALLAAAVAAAALGVVIEALALRGLFDLGRELARTDQRLAAMGALTALAAGLLLLDLPIARGAFALGRHLEVHLRLDFLRKLPRLGDRYFHSRLTSDMAERGHAVHRLRNLPDLAEWAVRSLLELSLTAAGIAWLDPGGAPLALAAGVVSVAVPLALVPLLQEWDLRVRSHTGALARFYLDALLGLIPLRTHGAQRAVRRQHEALLTEWARATLGQRRVEVAADGAVHVVLMGLVAAVLIEHVARRGLDGSLLLLVYWGLNLQTLGHFLTLMVAVQYPPYRNMALRLLEPLGAPEESRPAAGDAACAAGAGAVDGRGAGVALQGVTVRAGGHTILQDINLAVAPGSQVAIVGPSGAGKSSLVGLLLGWHQPAAGRLSVDGAPLDGPALAALRRATAWVDPAVQLWNRPLLANLLYGAEPDGNDGGARGEAGAEDGRRPGLPLDAALRGADLLGVLRRLPQGLQTPLGEGGGLVSGGEGQRVRFGRALLRPGVRLAVLDEPFRGLDRERRRELLARTRNLWPGATLLCVTHDVGETLDFERVLVVEGGRIVEDGRPADLAARPGSRYRDLLEAERQVTRELWAGAGWRRLRMESGRLTETSDPGAARTAMPAEAGP